MSRPNASPRSQRGDESGRGGPASTGAHSDRSRSTATSDRTMPHSIGGRFDGPKDVKPSNLNVDVRSLEMSFGMTAASQDLARPDSLPNRPAKPNSLGREVAIKLNTFHVIGFPTKKVEQYDVTMSGRGPEPSRMLMGKIWNSKAVQASLGGPGWIYDGNKLAWAMNKLPKDEVVIQVDLDSEQGKQSRGNNEFRVAIKYIGHISFTLLREYLAGNCAFSKGILETLSFLDHLMREGPSREYTRIKKSFFSRGKSRFSLGGGVEAFKGVFASMRMVHSINGPCLSVNVDVANGTFFTAMNLVDMVGELCRCRTPEDLQVLFKRAREKWHSSPMYRFLKCLTHATVVKKHLKLEEGKAMPQFKIHRFLPYDPYDKSFEVVDRDAQGNVVGSPRRTTVAEYFRVTYDIHCKRYLPLVEMTKKGELVPLELLHLPQNQRYKVKLDDRQTAQMIKFAVTLPDERWGAVAHGVEMLNWEKDKWLVNYGLKISATPAEVKGRILPCPEPTFANGKIDAKTASQGRWRIDGKKFLTTNANSGRHLKYWGCGIVDSGRGPCVSPAQARSFFEKFAKVYRGHGGIVETDPVLCETRTVRGGEAISDVWNAIGNKHQSRPHFIFWIVPDRNAETYLRLKKSCECRYGVVSQVMQSAHVIKGQDQYISNVCMKVNAKLGGATCRAVSPLLSKLDKSWSTTPTMIIGADVSHAAPGVTDQGSMAAMTCSMDQHLTRYAALCETNGDRNEIISTYTINKCLKQMVEAWMANFRGRVPERVIYYRDGVSSAQYQHVLDQEVADMKQLFLEINPKAKVPFTVIICAKRHHIRFFPQNGDRNKNPLPGTLVETGCTHPFEFDFYLAAHSAIKGTARPVHYHVILNECGLGSEAIQQLTFEHCFQYARSTTPVSMFPAVYYAHLASNRAKAHANIPQLSSGKKETAERKDREAKGESTKASSSETHVFEIPPLMEMNNQMLIRSTMWYI